MLVGFAFALIDTNVAVHVLVHAVYDKFAAVYVEAWKVLESRHDSWQCGTTEHLWHTCQKKTLLPSYSGPERKFVYPQTLELGTFGPPESSPSQGYARCLTSL